MRIGKPAGKPSTVTTSAGPWDSPAVRNRNTAPPRRIGVPRFYGDENQLVVLDAGGRAGRTAGGLLRCRARGPVRRGGDGRRRLREESRGELYLQGRCRADAGEDFAFRTAAGRGGPRTRARGVRCSPGGEADIVDDHEARGFHQRVEVVDHLPVLAPNDDAQVDRLHVANEGRRTRRDRLEADAARGTNLVGRAQ